MKVTLIDHTFNPEHRVATCAAICYDADTGEDANARRMRKLMDVRHLATLRFAFATFLIEGISRITSHQLVRAKHLDFLQESQRYVEQDDISFIEPDSFAGVSPEIRLKWAQLQQLSKDVYAALRQEDVRKEDARYALLHSSPTRLYVSGNLQAWADFLKNRTDKAAQWEIRQVALEVQTQLARIAPNVFKVAQPVETI